MKRKTLVDFTVVCTPPDFVMRSSRDLEKIVKEVERWCRNTEEFIKDHRSQGSFFLSVQRSYEEQCSFCENKWEEDEDGAPLCCHQAEKEWLRGKDA